MVVKIRQKAVYGRAESSEYTDLEITFRPYDKEETYKNNSKGANKWMQVFFLL